MTTASTSVAADAQSGPGAAPVRRRRSWVRRHRFAVAVTSLLLLVVVLRLAWGWYEARNVAAEWGKARALGEPTTPADLERPSLPDGSNAWAVYAQAVAAHRPGVDSPRNSAIEYPPYPPYGPAWEKLAAASEAGHAAAFPLARKARARPLSQLPQGTKRAYPPLNDARQLANTLADGAEHAHLRGDDAEAVERVLDTLHLGRSLRQEPSAVSQLVGIGIEALAADAAQKTVPALRLGDGAGDGGTPASPAQARALIASLLDESRHREWFVEALRADRVQMFGMLRDQTGGIVAVRPLADRGAARYLRDAAAVIRAAQEDRHPAARRVLEAVPADEREDDEASVALLRSLFGGRPSGPMLPRYSRWYERDTPKASVRVTDVFHQISGERRATAFVVAARLFRHDHGRWPDEAAELVPDYLPALPADPFRDDGGPIGYVVQRGGLPDGGDRPLVYFNSPGAVGIIDTEPMYGWQNDPRPRGAAASRLDVRQYRDVSLWQPPQREWKPYLESAAEAVDENPDEPDAPGDDEGEHGDPDRPAEQ